MPRASDGRIILPAPPGAERGCIDRPVLPARVPDNLEVDICLYAQNGQLMLEMVNGSKLSIVKLPFEGPATVMIGILIDTRFSAFWPEIEAVLGPDGTTLRDRDLADARRAFDAGRQRGPVNAFTASLNRPRDIRVFAYANSLARWGRLDEALAVLDEHLPRQPDEGRMLSDRNQFAWISNRVRSATLLADAGRFDEAQTRLTEAAAAPFVTREYRINARINHAALLAELGEAAEALRMIDNARRDFDAQHAEDLRIEGSRRQFDWIRACALHQLGRTGEATMLMTTLGADDFELARAMVPVPATESIAMRAVLCMADAERIETLAAESVQPGLPWPAAMLIEPSGRHARNRELIVAAIERAVVRSGHAGLRPVPLRYMWIIDRSLPAPPSTPPAN